MKMRTFQFISAAIAAALLLQAGLAHAQSQLIESWENNADTWVISPFGSNMNNFQIAGFSSTGVTDGSFSLAVGPLPTNTGTGPNYSQMLISDNSAGDAYAQNVTALLANASALSFDVYTPPGSFGGFLQFDVDLNNNRTGFVSLDNFSFPAVTLGGEATFTVPITPLIRSQLAASIAAGGASGTPIIIQTGGGFTAGNETFYLDNLRTTVATAPDTYTWNVDAASSWTTAANWDQKLPPSMAGTIVVFGSKITANRVVTLDGNQTVGHLTFNNALASYNLAPGSSGMLTIDNSSVALSNGFMTAPIGVPDITVSAGNHTISAPVNLINGVTIKPASGTSLTVTGGISGAGGLNVGDAGKVILTTPASYTGPTNVTAGTLQIAGLTGAGNLTVGGGATLSGTGAINGALIVQSGGAVDMRSLPSTVDTLSPNSFSLFGGSSLGFDIGSTADSIANGGAYTFSGSGTVAINLGLINGFHNGLYTLISNPSAGISLSQFSLPSNAIAGFTSTLQVSGNNLLVNLVATSATTAFWRGGRVPGSPSVWTATNGSTNWDTSATSNTDAGLPSTPTSVVFAANAATAANMANTTLGSDLTINSLEIQTANPVGIGGANTLTMNNGVTVDNGGGVTTISANVGLGLAQTWANNSANKLTVSGNIGGGASAALNIGGTGQIKLSGNNTYSGGTTVASGTLEVGHSHALGPDGSNVAQSGGAIVLDAGVAPVWSLTGAQGSQTISAAAGASPTLTIQTSGAQHTYGGVMQNGGGTLAVAVGGTGTEILTNANTYTGGTTINAGANLQLGDGATTNGSITGTVISNGTLTFSGDGTTSPGTGDQTFAGSISGAGGVTAANVGTVTLTGNNSYTGTTTITAGKLVAGSATALGAANLTIGPSATLDMNGKSLTVNKLTGTSTSNTAAATITNNDPGTGTAVLNVTNGGQFGGAITDGPSAKTALQVSSGTLIMTSVSPTTYGGDFGISSFTGGVTVLPGATLQVGNGNGGQGQSQSPTAASTVLGGGGAVNSPGGAINVGGGATTSTLAFQWQGGGSQSNYFLTNPINLNGNTLLLETEGNGHYTGAMSINGANNALQIRYTNKDVNIDGSLSGSGTITARGLDVTGDQFSGGGHLVFDTQVPTIGPVDNSAFTGTIALDETSPLGTPSANFSGIQLVFLDNASLPNGTIAVSGGNFNALVNFGSGVQNVGYNNTGATSTIVFNGSLNDSVDNPAFGALSSTTGGDFQLNDTFGGSVTLTLGTNAVTTASFGGILSGSGSIIKTGTSSQAFTAVNTYTGATTVQQGTLVLGVANSIASTSEVILSGGKLATGGFTQDFTTSASPAAQLKITSSSILDLGAATSPATVHFADSHTGDAGAWSGTLTIADWTYQTDHLIFGSDHNGLTNTQLGEIQFSGFHLGASISAVGEVTPRIGDINQDGSVNVADVQALMKALSDTSAYQQLHFAGAGSDAASDVHFILDVNGDGSVNNKDIQAEITLLANGPSPGGGSSIGVVPEPSSFVLLALGGIIAWGQQRRTSRRNNRKYWELRRSPGPSYSEHG